MKIEKPSKPLTSAATDNAARSSLSKSPKSNAPSSGLDSTSVHLGATSAQLRSLESSMASSPVVDVNKVAEIKSAISEGRFQINSGIVADKLIATARDLLSARAQ